MPQISIETSLAKSLMLIQRHDYLIGCRAWQKSLFSSDMGWRQSLITLILFTGQPGFLCRELGAYSAALASVGLPHSIFLFPNHFWPWKDVWPHFIFITLMKATEVSREPEAATCGALPYTIERPLGGESHLERAHCFSRLLALQRKRMLSLNVALTSLCHISKSGLITTRV